LIEGDEIPAGVQQLLRSSIHSIEELEVLLTLRGAVVRSWTAAELARELRLTEAMMVTALQALILNRLALQVREESPQQYQYRLQESEVEEIVAELSKTYSSHRLEIIMQISSNAIKRVREGALRTFSDAFRLPGRKKDG
jgi:hypothetical protein